MSETNLPKTLHSMFNILLSAFFILHSTFYIQHLAFSIQQSRNKYSGVRAKQLTKKVSCSNLHVHAARIQKKVEMLAVHALVHFVFRLYKALYLFSNKHTD